MNVPSPSDYCFIAHGSSAVIGMPPPNAGRRGEGGISAARRLVEKIMDLAGGLFIDARHLREIVERRALDGFQGAEMVQQRPLARRPDAGDFLQTGLPDIFLAPRAVRADGEAVRLVAQP